MWPGQQSMQQRKTKQKQFPVNWYYITFRLEAIQSGFSEFS